MQTAVYACICALYSDSNATAHWNSESRLEFVMVLQLSRPTLLQSSLNGREWISAVQLPNMKYQNFLDFHTWVAELRLFFKS